MRHKPCKFLWGILAAKVASFTIVYGIAAAWGIVDDAGRVHDTRFQHNDTPALAYRREQERFRLPLQLHLLGVTYKSPINHIGIAFGGTFGQAVALTNRMQCVGNIGVVFFADTP